MIINILICALAFMFGAYILKGVEIKDFWQALLVAVVVGLLDISLGNFLRIVSLGLLSWGIFNWLLNAIVIQVADWFLPQFKVKNFWWALALSAVVSIAASIMESIV